MTASERTPSFYGGTGTPLVLLHGATGSWPIWSPVLPLVTQHHTVLAPTLAGHRGGPGLPAGPLGIRPIADAVEQQMDELGWRAAHLVGNSLGGWVAAELGQRGRAVSVTLFSPAGAWNSPRDFHRLARKMRLLQRMSRWRSVHRLTKGDRGRRALFHAAMRHGDRISASEAQEMLADARYCLALEGLLSWIAGNLRLPPFQLDDVPARIAWADPDRTISWKRYGEAFARLVPGAEVLHVAGVGHVPMFDDPDQVARSILEFTRRVEQRRDDSDPVVREA